MIIILIEIFILIILYLYSIKNNKNHFSPEFIFLVFYILITSIYYYYVMISEVNLRFFIKDNYLLLMFLTFSGFISYVLIYIYMFKKKNKFRFWTCENLFKKSKKYYYTTLLISLVLILLIIGYYYYSGRFFQIRGKNQFNKTRIESLILSSQVFITMILFSLTHASLLFKSKISKSVKLILFLYIVFGIFIGSRTIVFFVIFGVLYILSKFKDFNYVSLIKYFFIGLFGNLLLLNLRSHSRPIDTLSNISNIITDNIRIVLNKLILGFAASEIDTLIADIYIYGERQLYYGYSYLGTFLNALFPKSIFNIYFVEPPGLLFRKEFYPKMSDHGYGFTMISESIMNFGVLGPIIILSLASYFLFNLVNNTDAYDIFLPIKTLVIIEILFLLRADFNSFIKSSLYSFIFFIFILLISGIYKFKLKYKNDI